jgi:hypothetical protein
MNRVLASAGSDDPTNASGLLGLLKAEANAGAQTEFRLRANVNLVGSRALWRIAFGRGKDWIGATHLRGMGMKIDWIQLEVPEFN